MNQKCNIQSEQILSDNSATEDHNEYASPEEIRVIADKIIKQHYEAFKMLAD